MLYVRSILLRSVHVAVFTKAHIVKAGALASLVKLTAMGREKLDVSRYCGMTLSNLACHRQNRVPIVQAGGLKPLCDMAFEGEHLEMQRAAGLALYNLSCSAVNQVGSHRPVPLGLILIRKLSPNYSATWVRSQEKEHPDNLHAQMNGLVSTNNLSIDKGCAESIVP